MPQTSTGFGAQGESVNADSPNVGMHRQKHPESSGVCSVWLNLYILFMCCVIITYIQYLIYHIYMGDGEIYH